MICSFGYRIGKDFKATLVLNQRIFVIAVIDWYIPKAEFYAYLKRLTDAGFSNRIMFGSDQMQWPGSIRTAIETIEAADFLTKEQKRDIFYSNAVRFFILENSK